VWYLRRDKYLEASYMQLEFMDEIMWRGGFIFLGMSGY
jgi:hypothetical protein